MIKWKVEAGAATRAAWREGTGRPRHGSGGGGGKSQEGPLRD